MINLRWIYLSVMLVIVITQSNADTYQVGATHPHKSLKAIITELKPGDVVEIEPGTYREVMKITVNGTKENPITIRGVGDRRPVFDAENIAVTGRGAVPRAIFQIEGDYIILEGLEMINARNGNNGAGIRLNQSTNAIIRDCKISYCDMGIQGGDTETVLIEYCDIGFNSTAEHNGYSHNFYMMGNNVVVRHCYIHDSLYGQNYKSRAHYNELWYNWIVDSNEGEVGPVDGKDATDRPNSHVLMVGNVIISKANRTGNTSKYILMGSELGGSHDGTLYMYHNILIAGNPKIQFIQLSDPLSNAEVHRNIFWGSDKILANNHDSEFVQGSHNWVPQSAQIPNEFTSNYHGIEPPFQNPNVQDYRLTQDTPLFQLIDQPIQYTDGDGNAHELTVDPIHLQSIRTFQTFTTKIHDFRIHETTN